MRIFWFALPVVAVLSAKTGLDIVGASQPRDLMLQRLKSLVVILVGTPPITASPGDVWYRPAYDEISAVRVRRATVITTANAPRFIAP